MILGIYEKVIEDVSSTNVDYAYLGSLAVNAYLPTNKTRPINDLDVVCDPDSHQILGEIFEKQDFKRCVIESEPKNTHFTFGKNQNQKLYKIHLVLNSLKVCDSTLQNIEFDYPLVDSLHSPTIIKVGTSTLKIVSLLDTLCLKLLPFLDQKKNERHLEDLVKLLDANEPPTEQLKKKTFSSPVVKRLKKNLNYLLGLPKAEHTSFFTLFLEHLDR
jgi:hypothetical protein